MSIRTVIARIASFFRRRQLDDELDEEVRTHLELLAADYERRGMTRERARAAARRAFGGIEQMKEVYRDRRRLQLSAGPSPSMASRTRSSAYCPTTFGFRRRVVSIRFLSMRRGLKCGSRLPSRKRIPGLRRDRSPD